VALTKVRGSGLGTLGDGTANDTAIVFDGNAQDFHIGLDDSSDSLTIGLGSALGTTSHMVFDANGIITKPLQPAFSVTNTGSALSWNAGTTTQVTFDGERFDVNGDFGSNQFTAPVDGKYYLSINMPFTNLDTGATSYLIDIFTSNRRYLKFMSMGLYGGSDNSHGFSLSILADMDSGDIAKAQVAQNGGANQTTLNNDAEFLHFTGYLVC